MANANDKTALLRQNLIDAGCDKKQPQNVLNLRKAVSIHKCFRYLKDSAQCFLMVFTSDKSK